MTLYWHNVGPLLRYQHGMLQVEDLNPEVRTQWRMTRWDMVKLGWRCIVASLRPH